MSSFFTDKTDPHIAEILERLRRVNKILQKTEYENLRNVREAHLLLCAQGMMDFKRPWRKDRFRILDDP